ncbi:Mis12-Mtw1 protein family-domain-containing protein [Achaetomium macrosporum]|uniref:Mis12-Mtw1 protein family-domain-containing protein n=1 Tax=Achaetomium macrosporum TaxID=79813 RepID=A0AAN7C7A7_9PEZI|nr:Mis12-Mtw1 protein family-domain-containing protein [Achaetomium macrosporum]
MGPPTGAGGRGESNSPKQSSKPSPAREDNQADVKRDAPLKPDESTNAEQAKPLAPPPRPAQQQNTNSPDYFNNPVAGSLSLEPNPFEQSFGGGPPETPGGTKLPSVAALTSPSSLLPGNTPFPWGPGSLRTGPLSPAMLSGPANDYFGDTHHLRGSFPTPNESSLRSGLTPGGSGSMFPAPSPNAALFANLPAPTPGTIDFHRTAMSARAKREQSQAQQLPPPAAPTSQPQEMVSGAQPSKPDSKFDPHDNDAANGLFMLAQGRNSAQPPAAPQYPVVNPPQQVNGAPSLTGSSARAVSEASPVSDETEQTRPNTRARGKRNSGTATTASRRKADDTQAKAPVAKKSRTNSGAAAATNGHDNQHSDDSNENDGGGKEEGTNNSKQKMTDAEKRKNFLERNRVAALKCRQRKKQWLANLQSKVEMYSHENEHLNTQIAQLREEVVNLKTLLLAHKDCPVTQQQGITTSYMQTLEATAFNPQLNPYAMPAPIQNQPVMAGQPMDRRFPSRFPKPALRHVLETRIIVIAKTASLTRTFSFPAQCAWRGIEAVDNAKHNTAAKPELTRPPPAHSARRSMSNRSERRSKRLAAAAVYDEQDGDFLFTRGSKRAKTAPVAGEEPEPEPTPAPAPAKKRVGRPPKAETKRRASPPAPAPSLQPPPSQSRSAAAATATATATATRGRRPKRKASLDYEPAAPPPEEEVAVPKSKVISLPFSDTPIINRNKEFRKKGGASGGRRSSLGMRGRRASSLIDNGHSALPHREVDPSEFYKYIAADGLSEPRRMKQLLIWCGERALSEKPPHGKPGSSAVLGARAIQDQLLRDFGARSEFSDWFAREDAPKPPVPVVLQPNPRNVDYDAKIAELEAKIERLKAQKKAWQAIAAPLPTLEPLYPDPSDPRKAPLPDPALLDESEAKILSALTNPDTAFSSFKRQVRSRLQNVQSALEFKVDQLADSVHKLDMRVVTAGREADAVLRLSAARLREREEREKEKVGTKEVPVMEVLRSLGRILPGGG